MDIKQISAQLRQVKNISEFAKKSGVSRSSLTRLLIGWSNPTLKTLQRVEDQLKKERQK